LADLALVNVDKSKMYDLSLAILIWALMDKSLIYLYQFLCFTDKSIAYLCLTIFAPLQKIADFPLVFLEFF